MANIEKEVGQNLANVNFFKFEYESRIKSIKLIIVASAAVLIYLLTYLLLKTDDNRSLITIFCVGSFLKIMFLINYFYLTPISLNRKIYKHLINYFIISQIVFVTIATTPIYWVFIKRYLIFPKALYQLSFSGQITLLIIISLLIFYAGVTNYLILKALQISSKRNYYQLKALQKEVNIWQQQISPHFVGNALSNLNRIIRAGETEKATNYNSQLVALFNKQMKFANIESITVEDEIDWIIIYLDVEKKRVPFHFQYTINVEKPDINLHQIPPMLLQPLLENSLIHGFSDQIDKQWNININFCELDTNTISIEITDNGIGKNVSFPKSKKSISINNISRRIELLNSIGKFEVNFEQSINDDGACNYLLIKTNNK